LPKGLNFDSLIALAPGARYETKGGGYQVDGASASENVFVIDGMDLTNLFSGALPRSGQIPFEFVQELQIKSSGFEAQYGGAMGGVINVVTRSGSNQLHGNFGLNFASDSLQAGPRPTQRLNPENDNLLDYFANQRDGYRLLNPGGALGGPIKKDKVWFFAGWYPELEQIDRTVTFNVDHSTGKYFENDRTDYLNGKLDAAPAQKLRVYAGYIYSPSRQNGVLPAQGGTDSPGNPWADKGSRSPAVSYTFGGDYLATPKLIFSTRGGYNYTNYKDYGVPRQTGIYYASSNKTIADVPAAWQAPAGWFSQANEYFQKNVQDRFRTNSDVSYSAVFAGRHTIKAGWETNRLHDSPNRNTYPDGYLRYYWNGTYTGINGTTMKGQYGYLRYRTANITGDASSSNQSVFLQDNWQLGKRLTLLLGLRTEREYVPSFAVADNIPSRAIQFGFGQKLAPRLGFAWDLKGDSTWKVAGSFGLFYDLMKYALPQGSFGGAKWKDYYYPLDKADPSYYLPLIPRDTAGLAADAPLKSLNTFEIVDWRIPANNPNDNTIDPNLKPMRRRVWDIGAEHALASTLVLNVRYTHNSMDRAIEDVGTLTPAGEKYYIANPGFGITGNPQTWGSGYPLTPKAKRDYDAVEIRADRRFSNHYYFSASYTWSRLWGNYSGLASTDDPAVPNPNASRYFDLPYASYDSHGKLAEGLLATDRPHTFKFYGAYSLKTRFGETNFGPNFLLFSGTPLTTELFAISSVPVYVNGRADLDRTPVFSQVDFYVYHEFSFPKHDQLRFRIDANISNLLNQDTVTSRYTNYLNRNDGSYLQFQNPTDYFKGFDWKAMVAQQTLRTDPGYNKDDGWQAPRNMRFGLKFIF
jgi:TonB dependent receptor